MNKHIKTFILAVSFIGMLIPKAEARIKLVALPDRAETIIRLDNPNYTLIEEERTLTLQQGTNKVDFSWKGVSIDPDSIRLEILTHPNQVNLINVSYPPNEAALVWKISSEGAWEEKVRVSYLLTNIDRLITYKTFANKEETQLDFKSHLVLRNFSGEDFENARILLNYGEAFDNGISHEETKRLLFFKAAQLPFQKVWHWDSKKQVWDPEDVDDNIGIPVTYRLKNKQENGLGQFALWGGKVRVFQEDGSGSTILLGEDRSNLVPVGENMDVYIGDSRDIVVTQRKTTDKQINIRRNRSNRMVLRDNEEIVKAEIENFKDSPATLTMVQHIPGEWDMKKCNMEYTKKDANTIEFEIELPANGKKELTMRYVRRNIR